MPMFACSTCTRWTVRLLAVTLAGAAACVPSIINTTSLGGTTPGQRGSVHVSFINNTPYRAIFTYGVYDDANTDFGPEFDQFFASSDSTQRLEGNSSSSIVTLDCGRVFSIGGQELLDRISRKGNGTTADQGALQAGIGFSDKPLDDPAADEATAGRAPAVITLQGADFPCGSLLVYTFTPDSTKTGGVRVDFQVIPP